MSDDDRRNHTRDNDGRQRSEDDLAPFDANPKTFLAIAATINLGSEKIQDDPFPESPAASGNVARLTLWALHG
jgi:hypothetical protein